MADPRIHPHAASRAQERGTSDAEMIATVTTGETFPAKHGRTGFRRNFSGPWAWRGKTFDTKQVEVYAVHEDGTWLVITALVKYF
ncbi:MAG: DUF4258 domain-containing protein [Gemmobacter sp.]